MRVLIHALGARMGGAKRHLDSFVPALSSVGDAHEFQVIVRAESQVVGGPNVEICRISDQYAVGGMARAWFDNIHVPRLARQFRADVILSLMNMGPILPPIPHFIMQRNALLFTKEYWKLFGFRQVMRFRMQRLLAIASMHSAQMIITPSASMATLIRDDCSFLPAERFAVLPHAFSPTSYQGALSKEVMCRLDRPGAKILYPCLAGPHKGLDLLLQIARIIPESLPASIFVTGGDEGGALISDFRRTADNLGLKERVVLLGRIPQPQMRALYQACDLMLYVSTIESFGFGLLEALAFELPVVAVDTPVNREVCGLGGIYFDQQDPESGARAIEDALAMRQEMKAASQNQFHSCNRTWDSYVQTLLRFMETENGAQFPQPAAQRNSTNGLTR